MSAPYVVAHRLGKRFGRQTVLEDVSFVVEPGDVVGVLGRNGAGKTTLLETIIGFTPPTSGSVSVFGHDSVGMPGSAKARIGFVPQQDELIHQLTARDQLAVIASFYPSWDHALIERLVAAWDIDLGKRIKSMSVGERQKLSILLALGHRPDLLVLDEPVASLDPIARRQFLEQIVEVAADERHAVVLSSHIVSDIERLATKIWIVKEGRLRWREEFDALKESIVRLHLRAARGLPPDLPLRNVISVQRTELALTAVVHDWSAAAHGELGRAAAGIDVEVEPLTLEEIFLELHR
jgi:ABC-2 type transport system ATP-binding protein